MTEKNHGSSAYGELLTQLLLAVAVSVLVLCVYHKLYPSDSDSGAKIAVLSLKDWLPDERDGPHSQLDFDNAMIRAEDAAKLAADHGYVVVEGSMVMAAPRSAIRLTPDTVSVLQPEDR